MFKDIFKGFRKQEEPWLSPYDGTPKNKMECPNCGCVGVIAVDGLEYTCTACGYEGILEETGD